MVEMTEFWGNPSPVSQCLIKNRGVGEAATAHQSRQTVNQPAHVSKPLADRGNLSLTPCFSGVSFGQQFFSTVLTVSSEARAFAASFQAFFTMPESARLDLKSQNCCLLSSF
jgi:hypothetical protein